MANNEITIDPNSGISEEEQREILSGINHITEKNRRSLSGGGAEKKSRFTAKKSGSLFPILVNAAALAALAGGFLLLSSFQGKTSAEIREGAKVYNSAERALIEEIRRETAFKIIAKENEISLIISELSGVDAQLQELHSSNQELTAEQRSAEERLRSLQDEYRSNLSTLQDERSRILEDSRFREAGLRAQLDARGRELAAVTEQSAAALGSAQSDLERLTHDQEKSAAIEAQLSGYIVAANGQIHEDRYAEAGETLKAMRIFLNTPAFQGIRALRAKKDFYTQVIQSLESMLEETSKSRGAAAAEGSSENAEALAEVQAKNAQLEAAVEGLNKTIAGFNTEGAGAARRVADLETQAAAQRTLYTALETSAAEKDRTISALEAEKAQLSQTVSQLRTDNQNQQERIAALDNQLSTLRQTLQQALGTQ